jgi:hypothetical protein
VISARQWKRGVTLLKKVLPIVEADKRFGYHSEAQAYMFDATSIKAKIGKLATGNIN